MNLLFKQNLNKDFANSAASPLSTILDSMKGLSFFITPCSFVGSGSSNKSLINKLKFSMYNFFNSTI